MPLSQTAVRREIHRRVIEMNAYAREDGLYDVEAHLVDTKPFDFLLLSSPQPVPAGQALHDLWVRLTLDKDYVVRAIAAASDVTPYEICKEAESTLSVLIGERVVRGWSVKVKEKLRGAASCNHLMEMLITLATTALQGIWGTHPQRIAQSDEAGAATKIDSCYAYGRQREIVKRMWPQHYEAPSKPGS